MEVGEVLPRVDQAVVTEEKLRGYVLNAEHGVGLHKARVFAATLDLHADDWEWLRGADPRGDPGDSGDRYSPLPRGLALHRRHSVHGRNDEERPVVTGWRVPDDGTPPHLVTAYVETEREGMR